MVELLRLLELFAQFGQAQAVGGARLLVEHLTGVTQVADVNPGLARSSSRVRQSIAAAWTASELDRALNQVQNVELDAGMAEQAGNVRESFAVS